MSDDQKVQSPSQLVQDLKSVTCKDDVTFLSFDKPKKTKKKKKKNSDVNVNLLMNGQYVDLSENTITDNDSISPEATLATLNLIDTDSIYFGDDDEDEFTGIVKTQKGGYTKLQSNDNRYKKEFSEELVLMYNLLDELNSFDKRLNRKIEAMDTSKARGMSKHTADLLQSYLACKTNKLHVLKEITNIKKAAVDFQFKDDRANGGKSNGENSPEVLASSYLNQILGMGRNKFISAISNQSISPTDNINFDDEDFADDLDNRLRESNTRTEELDKYVQYEHLEPKICIKKYIDSGDWDFIVMDKFNKEIRDYPKPSVENAGTMRFSDDGLMASDKHGRSYKVIEVISGGDDFDDE